MQISREEVLHVANLAHLTLSEEETEKLRGDMETIIQFANALNELNTDGVVPTSHARPMSNAFRDDIVEDSYDRDELLKNAPEVEDGGFAVPKVVD